MSRCCAREPLHEPKQGGVVERAVALCMGSRHQLRQYCAQRGGGAGAAGSAPYDVILIEGAVQVVPQMIFDQLAEGGRLTTVVAGPPGALGVAQLFMKEGGMASGRPLFDAGTPSLPGFAPPPRFTF